MRTFFLILFICLTTSVVFSQKAYMLTRKGNNQISNQQYVDAEVLYKKALQEKKGYRSAVYNTGNAEYGQERYEDAQKSYDAASALYTEKEDKSDAFHNLGNSLLEQKKYEESIEAYKKALRLEPTDLETKYNLAYAQKMLEKEQQQQQNQEQEQDQENEEQKENEEDQEQDGEENNEEEGEGDEEKEDEGKPDEEKDEEGKNDSEKNQDKGDKEPEEEGQSQPQQVKLSKEEAEQLLKALAAEEAKLQEDMNEENMQPVQIEIEKDW